MHFDSNRGVLLVDIDGTELTREDKKLLVHPAVAGVVLFTKNYHNRTQLIDLVHSVRDLRDNLLICVDHEGGRIQRFRDEFTQLPPARSYYQDFSSDQRCDVAHESGWLMASELLSCGIDLSFGPVLDIDHGRTSVVDNRAFGRSVSQVIELASAWISGVHEAGMSVVIKHFPGHGNVDDDSHVNLPVDERSFERVYSSDMEPFREMIRLGVEAVMPAHVLFPSVDHLPVGFSGKWIKDILKKELGFEGLVVSDCLSMEGAAKIGGYPARVQAALDAGCDLTIISNRPGCLEVLASIDAAYLRGVGPGGLAPNSYGEWSLLETSDRYQNIHKVLTATL